MYCNSLLHFPDKQHKKMSINQAASISFEVLLLLQITCLHAILSPGEAAPIVVSPVFSRLTITGCVWNNTKIECDSLEHALDGVQVIQDNSLTVDIPLGNHNLGKRYMFTNKMGIHIRFNGLNSSDTPIVRCNGSNTEGIGFQNSTDIRITYISFLGCGALQHGTSRDWTDNTRLVTFSVALYFLGCKDVYISGVHVLNSNGTGMAMLNTVGTNTIEDSEFRYSRLSAANGLGENIGGSGVRIEFMQNSNTNDAAASDALYIYTLSNVTFAGNIASSGIYQLSRVTNEMNNLFTFGMGGGLSISFGPNSASKEIIVDNCTFSNNFANQGGGLSIVFLRNSQKNRVTVKNSRFRKNKCTMQDLPPTHYSQGGGMAVNFQSSSKNNSVVASNTTFTENNAYFGGGLSLHSGLLNNEYSAQTESQGNTFEVIECKFTRNSARVGAAMDLYCRNPVNSESICSTTPKISHTNFTNNSGKYVYKHNSGMGTTFATLNIQYLPVIFQGNLQLLNNSASGLGLQEAVVEMKELSTLTFSGNKGKVGGGMVLIGLSTIILNSHCKVFFNGNSATERGAAVLARQTQERYIAYDYSCFFRHVNWSTHPDDWSEDGISISFSNNTITDQDRTPTAIFVSSLLPCVWPSNLTSKSNRDIASTFCSWNSWHFDDDTRCKDQIRTLPANFGHPSYNLSVYPGQTVNLNKYMQVFDDFQHNVVNDTIFIGLIEQHNGQEITNEVDLQVTGNGKIQIYGNNPNHTVDILLQTTDERSISTKLKVNLMPCPPGTELTQRGAHSECACLSLRKRFYDNLQCTIDFKNPNQPKFVAFVFDGNCISYRRNNTNGTELFVAHCPYLAGDICPNIGPMRAYRQLPDTTNAAKFDKEFCATANRQGPLCGQCIDNFGIDIFSSNYKCVNCTKHPLSRQWTIAAMLIIVPITVFFLIVTIFHIGVTSASTNGYIFFSHVVNIPLNVLIIDSAWNIVFQNNAHHNGKALTTALFLPYRIWSLEFPQIFYYSKMCLSHRFKASHILTLHYTNAVYALLLVFVTYIVIELHARNYRPLVCLWKPLCFLCVRFRRNWEMRTSVIDAFATVILLSYSKLVGVSISLLTPSSVYIANGTRVDRVLHYDTSVKFFSKEHRPFAAIAIFILLTVGAIPPFLLLLYPFQWFQKLLNMCHLNRHSLAVFMDAFQGIYKNRADKGVERRYFAAIYFIFRIIINVLFTLPLNFPALYTALTVTYVVLLIVVVVLRPYKNNFYNNLDAVFITILVIINSMIGYCVIHAVQFGTIPHAAWIPTYTLGHLPTLYMMGFCVYWICSRSRLFQTYCTPQCLRVQDKIRYFRKNEETERIVSSYRILTSPMSPAQSSLLDSDQLSRSENYDQSDDQSVSNRLEDHGVEPKMIS